MNLSIAEFAVTSGESINGLSIVIGLIGLIGGIIGIIGVLFGIYIWFYDRKNVRVATLYVPLSWACRDVIKISEDHDKLDDVYFREIFKTCDKTLHDIVYTHGSITYMESAVDQKNFEDLKDFINETLGFLDPKTGRSPEDLREKFSSQEFKDGTDCAKALLSTCRREVKILRKDHAAGV